MNEERTTRLNARHAEKMRRHKAARDKIIHEDRRQAC